MPRPVPRDIKFTWFSYELFKASINPDEVPSFQTGFEYAYLRESFYELKDQDMALYIAFSRLLEPLFALPHWGSNRKRCQEDIKEYENATRD